MVPHQLWRELGSPSFGNLIIAPFVHSVGIFFLIIRVGQNVAIYCRMRSKWVVWCIKSIWYCNVHRIVASFPFNLDTSIYPVRLHFTWSFLYTGTPALIVLHVWWLLIFICISLVHINAYHALHFIIPRLCACTIAQLAEVIITLWKNVDLI